MLNILDVLMPTIVFTVCAILTLPLLRFVRRRKLNPQLFMVVWIFISFAAASVSVLHIATEYYAQPQPFLNISSVGESMLPLSSSFLVDAVSVYMAMAYLVVGLASCLYGVLYVKSNEPLSERYYALILMVTGTVMAATFSGDLLTLFIFWEATAAGSCFLVVYRKTRKSLEASLKYLVMIIIASGFIVYGLSMVYGLTGSLNFWTAREALMTAENKQLLVIAFAFITAGYAIETAIVPFHMWLPDAYTAAPSSSSAFLSALIDQGSYYILMRVLIYILTPPAIVNWPFALAIFSALTMTVGNLFALAQNNVKRMISYVCVADIGYNLVAITSVTSLGIMANLFFFLVAAMETALSFMATGILNDRGLETLEDLSGIGRKMPMTSLAFVISALSFAGVPPLAGFVAKYMVFTSAIESNVAWLAVIGVLNTVLQSAYFLRVIHYLYAKAPKNSIEAKEPRKLLVPIYLLVIAIVLLGIYPALALNLIYPAAGQINPLIP
jgi:proton-translocating NADH-quinone oxidoreductase chain N